MTEPNDLHEVFDEINAHIPPPQKTAEHRAALMRRAEVVTGSADARPLEQSVLESNALTLSVTNGNGRHKRMSKRLIIALAAALMLVSTALAQQIIQYFTRA